jgi:hypothetical protein
MHRQSAISNLHSAIEKGATLAPFFTGEVGCYRFLPAFFFPPLAFFAIVCYPPLHLGLTARALTHIAHGCRLARSPDVRRSSLRGTFRDYRKGELETLPSSFTRDGRELTILIPDVDSNRHIRRVKHKPIEKVKKIDLRRCARTRSASDRASPRTTSTARRAQIASSSDPATHESRCERYMLVRSCCLSA